MRATNEIRECLSCGSLTPWTRCPCCNGDKLDGPPFDFQTYSEQPQFEQCPQCHFVGLAGFDYWDSLGADSGNVFCQRCHCEFDPTKAPLRFHPQATDLRRVPDAQRQLF